MRASIIIATNMMIYYGRKKEALSKREDSLAYLTKDFRSSLLTRWKFKYL